MALAHPGLDGVVAAETALSDVDGERGELTIAGYPLPNWPRSPPSRKRRGCCGTARCRHRPSSEAFRGRPGQRPADLAPATLDAVAGVRGRRARRRWTLCGSPPALSRWLVDRRRQRSWRSGRPSSRPTGGCGGGGEPVAPRCRPRPRRQLPLPARPARSPEPERVRGLETYLNTVVDHGLNASTFTARVITSTGSDLVSAVVGALGALKGPLHGGAPGPALDMVFEIGEPRGPSRCCATRSPRREADGLRPPRLQGARSRGPTCWPRPPSGSSRGPATWRSTDWHARSRPRRLRVLEEAKPGRRLQTNVEFYTALLLHGLGLDVGLFTPTFAISRVSGWIAHAAEQRRANRIIRPQSEYVGPAGGGGRDRTMPASAGNASNASVAQRSSGGRASNS